MTKHFILLKLPNRTFKDQVSTEGCSYVADFKIAIKKTFPNLLATYDAAQLNLLPYDESTLIDPQTSVDDLDEIPWKPMVVTVQELPMQSPSKKQCTYSLLKLGKRTYKRQVSTEGCYDVDDFKDSIKKTFPILLAAYDAAQLTVLQPDGTTEIDPGETVASLNESNVSAKTPLVVTVRELPMPAPIGSSQKQLMYKEMSTEASCRKYFDALAVKLSQLYHFPCRLSSSYPTMGDVFEAVKKNTWGFQEIPMSWSEITDGDRYIRPRKNIRKHDIALPNLFNQNEWKVMKELNKVTNERFHSASLPYDNGKSFIVLPTTEFSEETALILKKIAVKGTLLKYENDLVVKREAVLSGSSGSEASGSF